MKSFLAKSLPIIIFGCLILFFFKPFFIEGKLPIPADTIVGMYHPWRDFYAKDYPNGKPFKNFLITDPVRQQYSWRYLAIDLMKHGQWPLWNPYQFSGTPLLANFQSAPFYPLNILFFILPFNLAWGILVILQPILAGVFLYAYLRHLKISQLASLVGSLSFSFSGFFIAWLEWGTVLHSALWLPLILLSIDKIIIGFQSSKISDLRWLLIFLFSLFSSFLAGHLQTFFYVGVFSMFYVAVRWWQNGRKTRIIFLFTICYLLFAILTSVQWLPTLKFIHLSSREIDRVDWQQSGWFIPWQHLLQFFAPDFFGNPTTLNYWGEWNYGEFAGYIGVLPLILALLAVFWRYDKKTLFFGSTAFISLIFALPTPLAKLPYQWQLPLVSTSQPTRLLFLTDFSLSILAALGFDWFTKHLNDSNQLSKIVKVILLFGVIFGGLWVTSIFGQNWLKTIRAENLAVAKRNLILPTILFISGSVLLLLSSFAKRQHRSTLMIRIIIVVFVVFDLFRFGWKFTPFTKEEWLFPETQTIKFLKNQSRPFRFMTTDRRIFPPNFATFYYLEDVSGYDPLYLKSYAELVAAWDRGKPDITPFSFNRILDPQDYSSRIADLLNVKYVLSLKDEVSPKLKLVFQEGQTRVYENKNVLPRAFFVQEVRWVDNKEEAIKGLFREDFNSRKTAIVEKNEGVKASTPLRCKGCRVEIVDYSENKITIKTENQSDGFLVLVDTFYPGWYARIYAEETGSSFETKIYRTDFNFRGIVVPKGKHRVEFYISLLQ